MKFGQQRIILKDNPEGYITNNLEDNIAANKLKAEDRELKFIDLPDIGTITFIIELLNMTGPNHPTFTIATRIDTMNYTITDTQLPAIPMSHLIEQYVTLKYSMRSFQMVGGKVRIKYKGKPYIHVHVPLTPVLTREQPLPLCSRIFFAKLFLPFSTV